jgi:hypothetical protein
MLKDEGLKRKAYNPSRIQGKSSRFEIRILRRLRMLSVEGRRAYEGKMELPIQCYYYSTDLY